MGNMYFISKGREAVLYSQSLHNNGEEEYLEKKKVPSMRSTHSSELERKGE